MGFEESGVVRQAFRAKGHDAWSCDLLPARDNSPFHIQADMRDVIYDRTWTLAIMHPPCTYLSSSGLHWNKRRPERSQLTKEAVMLFLECWEAPIPYIAIENPVGCMSTILRRPDQYFQPYEFGEDASKKTGLWLKGVKKLPINPVKRFNGRMVEWPKDSGKLVERWSNQTDSGQNRLGPSVTRARERSETYPKIALAMAENWG